jgi:hypothetical protein
MKAELATAVIVLLIVFSGAPLIGVVAAGAAALLIWLGKR